METLINPNQIGNRPKIANVNLYGDLTINNNIVSNFSQTNYLTIPLIDRFSDNTIIICNANKTSDSFKTFNTFECVFKIKLLDEVANSRSIFTINTFDLYISDSKKIHLLIPQSSGIVAQDTNLKIDDILPLNTDIYCKTEFNGDSYNLAYSLDGVNYISTGVNSSNKMNFATAEDLIIGNHPTKNYPFMNGSIDLVNSYIKANGDFWWKGVETL